MPLDVAKMPRKPGALAPRAQGSSVRRMCRPTHGKRGTGPRGDVAWTRAGRTPGIPIPLVRRWRVGELRISYVKAGSAPCRRPDIEDGGKCLTRKERRADEAHEPTA